MSIDRNQPEKHLEKVADEVANLRVAFRFQDALIGNLSSRVENCESMAGIRLPTSPSHRGNSPRKSVARSDTEDESEGFNLSASLASAMPSAGISTHLMSSVVGNLSSLQLPTISHSQALATSPQFFIPQAGSSQSGSPSSKKRKSTHKGCNFPECDKLAHGPDYKYCLRHGGGYRCQMPGCPRSAYSTKYCSKHGGGPRCQLQGCNKGAISNSSFCRRHGGGPRCQHPNCTEGARTGFNYCLAHGGYNSCSFPSCPCPALHTSAYCRQHNSYQRKMANAQVMALSGLTAGLFSNPLDDFPKAEQ